MNRIIIGLVLCLSLASAGCWSIFSIKVPKSKETQEQQETNKTKTSGSIKGKITLPETPITDKNGNALPNQIVKIDGIEASVPRGSIGELSLNGDNDSSVYTISSLFSQWKLNSPTTGLILLGGIMIAAGCVLVYYRASGVGIGAIIGGGVLVGCSVMIDKYPLVILAIVLVGILVGIYFLYSFVKSRNLSQVKEDSIMVIAKIAQEIEKLPKEIQEQVKVNLQKDDNSATIKKIVSEAKNL